MKLIKRPLVGLTSVDPFRGNLDQWVDTLFGGMDLPSTLGRGNGDWNPSLDVAETDAAYTIRLEAPGVARKDLEVHLEGQVLTIHGARSTATGEDGERLVWREREEGRFTRTLRLPLPVEEQKAEARIDEGVVTITVPKKHVGTSTKVPIK